MTENFIAIIGNLVADPDLKYGPNGEAIATMRVAVNRRLLKDGEWSDGETSYFTVVVWRGLAENAVESLVEGSRVIVTGRLQMRSWETPQGDRRSVIEIEATDVAPALANAIAKVERVRTGAAS